VDQSEVALQAAREADLLAAIAVDYAELGQVLDHAGEDSASILGGVAACSSRSRSRAGIGEVEAIALERKEYPL
jgi:hypothetical protein